MENLLKEEIERYKRLSFYDTKKTLTENSSVISEAPTGASLFRDAENAIKGGAFKSIEEFIAKKMKFTTLELGDVTRLLGKSATEFAMELELAIAKDIQSGVKNGMGPAFKEMSKVDVLRKMAQESRFKGGKALSKAEIEKIIGDVASENKLKASEFARESAGQGAKEGEDAFRKITDPDKKKWPWKKLLKWGAGLGISVGVLYYIYKKTHNNTPPVPVPPVPPVPVPPVPVPPRPSQYRTCPDTFPIAQFCKNETVRKVQGCLGLTTDGLFGPKTKTALEGKGLNGTSITQDTVNKACSSNTAQVDPDVEDVDGQDPNTI
jgi:hypothetical protein